MQCLRGGRILSRKIFQSLIGREPFITTFKSWRIVFFGSDTFSIVSLKKLVELSNKNVIESLEVVTTRSTNPVYTFSVTNNIKIHFWPPELHGSYDLGVIVSFGRLIPKDLIDIFPLGIINVHASLLPKWRGAMPIVHAIMNGDTTTGITIQKISPHAFDVGDTILKRPYSIGENELLPSLYNRLSKYGSECLVKVIRELPDSLKNGVQQDNEKASYARKINKEISIVKWNELTAEEVYNLYRALFGLHDLKTFWKGTSVKLFCISPSDIDRASFELTAPGTVNYSKENDSLLVKCRDKPIRVCTVMTKGKLYSAKNFYTGFLTQSPTTPWMFDH